jgi:hypothetical protein
MARSTTLRLVRPVLPQQLQPGRPTSPQLVSPTVQLQEPQLVRPSDAAATSAAASVPDRPTLRSCDHPRGRCRCTAGAARQQCNLVPIPTDCNCLNVPFGSHHWAFDYCYNVRWSCEYLCCV